MAREKVPDPRDVIPFVQESVFLHHPGFRCELPPASRLGLFGLDGDERRSGLAGISDRLLEAPTDRQAVATNRDGIIVKLMQRIGVVQRRQREVGSWIIDEEPLAEGEGWQDWPAFHRVATTDRARIRFLITPPGAASEQRTRTRRLTEHEFQVMSRLAHDGVASPRDVVDAELGIGLVYPLDERYQRLDLWLADQSNGIPASTQLAILRQVAEAVGYAHRHRVVHRGLTPQAVSVRGTAGGRVHVRVGDWQTAGGVRAGSSDGSPVSSVITALGAEASTSSEAGQRLAAFVAGKQGDSEGRLAVAFQAPEGVFQRGTDRVRLDVFALGALAYYLIVGHPALGRAGRRPGSARNCLFLCLEQDDVLQAAGLLLRWSQGWVEPVRPPPSPRHIVAQQLLALALQEHTIGVRTWPEWWGGLNMVAEDGPTVLGHLVEAGYLETDGDLAFIGPEAEKRFGRRYFSDLTAVFSAAPGFTVLAGREEIGTVGDDVLVSDSGDGPRVLLLAGRAWLVTYVDWKRRRCFVELTDLPGKARWSSSGGGLSFEVTRGMRDALLGTDPRGVVFSRRAGRALAELREHHSSRVRPGGTVLERSADGDVRWWTWAGSAANRTLHASLTGLVDRRQRLGDRTLRMRADLDTGDIAAALRAVDASELASPPVNAAAVSGLKFSAALPPGLAEQTVAARLGDRPGAATTLAEHRTILHAGS